MPNISWTKPTPGESPWDVDLGTVLDTFGTAINGTVGSATPLALGTASAGTQTGLAAAVNHIHPTTGLYVVVVAPTGVAATDTANIQAACDAANTAGGGIVQLQAGSYRIAAPGSPSSGGVRVLDNTTLAGMGIGTTILKVADGVSTDITGIIRTPSGVQNTRVTFRDLTIDGNNANLSGTPTIIGFFCGVTPNSTQTDTDITCSRVEIINCSGYGFDPHERTTRLLLDRCISRNNGTDGAHDGFTLDGCYDSRAIACVATGNGRHGFNLVTASTRVELLGCESYGNTSNGITLQNGAKHCKVVGGEVYNNSGDGIYINGIPQSGQQDNTPGADHTVIGVEVVSNANHGIHLASTSYNSVASNTIRDSGTAANNTYSQIYFDDDGSTFCTYNRATGNTMRSSAANKPKYGIREKSSSSDLNFILGNSSTDAVTTQTSLLGATSLQLAAHNGVNEHPTVAPYVTDTPAQHSYKEWTYSTEITGSGTTGGTGNAGVCNGSLIIAHATVSVTTIAYVVVNSQTVTNCYVGLFDGAGNLLAASADQSTAVSTAGIKNATISSTALTAGANYFILFLFGSGTAPGILRLSGSSGTGLNAGLSASFSTPYKFFATGSSLTTLPSSFTAGSMSSSSVSFWFALS